MYSWPAIHPLLIGIGRLIDSVLNLAALYRRSLAYGRRIRDRLKQAIGARTTYDRNGLSSRNHREGMIGRMELLTERRCYGLRRYRPTNSDLDLSADVERGSHFDRKSAKNCRNLAYMGESLSGAWLARQRERLWIKPVELAQAIGCDAGRLITLEVTRARLPEEWRPALRDLGFFDSPYRGELPAITGAWLRAERERLRLSQQQIADHLHAAPSRVRIVERIGALVPDEWIAGLSLMGFRTPNPAPDTPPALPAAPALPIAAQALPGAEPSSAAPFPPLGQEPPPAAPKRPRKATPRKTGSAVPATASKAPSEPPSEAAATTPALESLPQRTIAMVQAHAELGRALGLSPLQAISRLAADLHAADPCMPAMAAGQAIGMLCQALAEGK